MTEKEWSVSTDRGKMLKLLGYGASGRKLRLFLTSCCRRLWDLIQDERCRKAIEVAERFAEGQLGKPCINLRELSQADTATPPGKGEIWSAHKVVVDACSRALRPPDRLTPRVVDVGASYLTFSVAVGVCAGDSPITLSPQQMVVVEAEERAQCDHLRDIFGNPFRSIVIDPTWLTPAVVALAQTAYDERLQASGHLDVARLAVLSDALEEAGCTDESILCHLRSPGPHVCGCFVLDLILAKE